VEASSTPARDTTTVNDRNELFMGSRLSVRFGPGQDWAPEPWGMLRKSPGSQPY
jgi:hypothetical protein